MRWRLGAELNQVFLGFQLEELMIMTTVGVCTRWTRLYESMSTAFA